MKLQRAVKRVGLLVGPFLVVPLVAVLWKFVKDKKNAFKRPPKQLLLWVRVRVASPFVVRLGVVC